MAEERIQFDHVTLPATDAYGEAVAGISFALRPGECLLIGVGAERLLPPVADVAEGLLDPADGVVRIEGAVWAGVSGDDAVRLRSRIGRVFEEHAWLSNLDVDENVTLAARHHTTRPESEIRAEAKAWARRFGHDDLPSGRPAWASRPDLQVAQWVRALLGRPHLLLLERPTREVSDEACAGFVEAVEECRQNGAAVIWLTQDERVLNNAGLCATQRAVVRGGRWECENE